MALKRDAERKLAATIAAAVERGDITRDRAAGLLGGLLFEATGFEPVSPARRRDLLAAGATEEMIAATVEEMGHYRVQFGQSD